jgi:hypothetical protein
MKKRTYVALMATTPVAIAMLVVFVLPSFSTSNTEFSDRLEPHGYVIVSIMRGGNEIYHYEDHNLITNAGKDFISAQLGSTSPGVNGANYIALSSNSVAPAATDTTLTGEIASGGLSRAQGTYSHTTGAGSYTITHTFTASSSHTDVQKAGLFTASSGGTMMAESTFTAATLANNDTLTITWTINY